ncbi:MAG: diaminopimelate epimerase [Pseudomonadota bacterium]
MSKIETGDPAGEGSIPFVKMHGAGNDFVIFDARTRPLSFSSEVCAAIADRRRGIGCDQVIILREASAADVWMQIFNADGSESGACGNATRCVAWLLDAEREKNPALTPRPDAKVSIETAGGLLTAWKVGPYEASATPKAPTGGAEPLRLVESEASPLMAVDMGLPKRDWQDIPLAWPQDTDEVDLRVGPLANPVAVNMGNPHVVFFVDPAAAIDLAKWGAEVETNALFPERVNVSVAEVVSPKSIRLRVWERGAGLTQACGTAACATYVAARERKLVADEVAIQLPGGKLVLSQDINGRIIMTGPIAFAYEGRVVLQD